ncbi:hypothetical protein ACHAQA_002146 [Verticillium albo-atrum]
MASSNIKTKVLIISDTHGKKPLEDGPDELNDKPKQAYRCPLPRADVAIHCGDLTLSSKVQEFEDTFAMIRALDAPLKIVIAGNHDIALDLRERYIKRPDAVAAIIEAAAQDGVHFLGEGTREFELHNGARLRVYASPMTPEYGGWAFQYPYGEHEFDIQPGDTDIAITHGPPKGIRDTCRTGDTVGCHELFSAVAKAKPKIHCFGHIHEAWGAELVTWKNLMPTPTRLHVGNAVDREQTQVLHSLRSLTPLHWDWEDDAQKKVDRREKMYRDKCVPIDLASDGPSPLRDGEQTLFVNAAIMDIHYHPTNVPWLIDVDLPKAATGV